MEYCCIDETYPIYGSHLSVCRTLRATAVKCLNYEMSVFQVYYGSGRGYKRRMVSDTDVVKTKKILDRYQMCAFSHAALCYNLAKWIPHSDLIKEIDVFSRLNYSDKVTSGTVIHVGKHTDPAVGIEKVISNVNSLLNIESGHDKTKRVVILENAAGQGWRKEGQNRELGSTLDELETVFRGVDKKEQLYFCIDTQHLFARGEWPIHQAGGFIQFLSAFDERIGADRLACVHLNDSKTVYGSQVDRHAPLGMGEIFRESPRVLKDLIDVLTYRRIPMISETGNGFGDKLIVRAMNDITTGRVV
jgi:deoxyribonuclease-4